MLSHFDKWTLLLTASAAAGCAGNVAGPGTPGDADASMTTNAVVVVERSTDAIEGARAQVSARFVRVAAGSSAQDAMRAVGAALELPARGECASVSALSGGITRAEAAPVVELVDVGSVWLDVAGARTRLVPRQVPDVTDVVSGVVYARASDAALLPAAARYEVHVSGSPGREAFDAAVDAPADPSDITVTGEEAGGGPLVARGSSVALTWPSSGADDLVYVEVRPGAVRCVLDGVVRGGSTRATLSTSNLDDAGSIVLHRVHREALHALGVDGGEVRFDFARSIAYVRPYARP
ncbi:MAG TPA: hypothetical protein VKU41_29660 [Polyangiaceae bacterium]|nr:hypothetical protein [Polyangiaceae bacterium]